MHRGAAALVVLVLLGCTGDARSDAPPTAPPGEDGPTASETVPDIVIAETATETDNGEVAASVDVGEVCLDRRPVVTAQIGSVNTLVVPTNAQYLDGDVEVIPVAACPGDMVSFEVSVVNVSEEPQVFSAGRGLIFYSGQMSNWSVVSLRDLEMTLQPGERVDQTVVGTIPPVAPGTYRVGPEGSGFFGEIVVLDPTDG